MVGIIAAMEIEMSLLRNKLENERSRKISGKIYYNGKLCGQEVVLSVCGVGKVNAAICAQTMCLEYSPEIIINTGVAGALAKGLGVGDIVIAQNAVQHDMDTTAIGDEPGLLALGSETAVKLPCDKDAYNALLEQAQTLNAKAVLGTVASGDQFIHDPKRKAFLRSQFNAACCEMEGGAIAHVCEMNAVKCAIVRVMSDSADGTATLDFPRFAPKAADLSAKTVQGYLTKVAG